MSVARVGAPAPDFEALTQDGERVRLSDYTARGPVVLFFYPKAMTPGCTKESCHFRDLRAEFEQINATPLGISADSPEAQTRFSTKYDFNFPLLSDVDGTAARLYGAARPGPLFNRRMTFVIGADGTLVEILKSELNMEMHADRALEILRARTGADLRRVVRLEETEKKVERRRS
jgi:thioredoxin-dependent peroxiredoxin